MSSRTESHKETSANLNPKRDEVDPKKRQKKSERRFNKWHRVFLVLISYVSFLFFYYAMTDGSLWHKNRPTFTKHQKNSDMKDCSYATATLVRKDLQPYPSRLIMSSELLRKQEYDIMVYLYALRNAVKLIDVPDTRLHKYAVRDCERSE
jgi:uncharacterized protein YpmS